MFKIILTMSILFLFSACSTTRYVSVKYDVPAKADLKKYKTVSIEPIDGDFGNQFSDALVKELMAADTNKRYQILYRNNIAPIVREDILSSPNKTKSKMKTADLLIVGSVSNTMNTIPADPNMRTSSDQKYTTVSSNIKLIDGRTSEVLFASSFSNNSSSYETTFSNGMYAPPPSQEMLDEASQKVIDEILTVLFPSVSNNIYIIQSDNSVPEIKEATLLFDDGQYAKAYEKYQLALKNPKLSDEDKGNALLGMALLKLQGRPNFDEAMKLIEEAKKYQILDETFRRQMIKVMREKEKFPKYDNTKK